MAENPVIDASATVDYLVDYVMATGVAHRIAERYLRSGPLVGAAVRV